MEVNIKIDIVACRDPLLGYNLKTNNETTLAAKQQILNNQQLTTKMKNGVF
jgi:hypothetical protein